MFIIFLEISLRDWKRFDESIRNAKTANKPTLSNKEAHKRCNKITFRAKTDYGLVLSEREPKYVNRKIEK